MTRILLVRHGKAADHWGDYDRLSESGARQSRHLAERLIREEETIAAAFHGKMRRQRETAEVVAATFAAAGRPFPAPVELPGLDEMAPGVVDAALLAEPDLALRERVTEWIIGKRPGGPETQLFLLSAFHRFARGELAGDFEPYTAFHARVTATLGALRRLDRGTCVAFTSGGFIATAAGLAMEAPLAPTLQLMATLENTSITELRHSVSRDAFSLVRLNDVGHVPLAERTLI
jgi:broad specificity phosphatase PhoE